jgi:uncharacterized membrane protein YbhN (UPF0104 family)
VCVWVCNVKTVIAQGVGVFLISLVFLVLISQRCRQKRKLRVVDKPLLISNRWRSEQKTLKFSYRLGRHRLRTLRSKNFLRKFLEQTLLIRNKKLLFGCFCWFTSLVAIDVSVFVWGCEMLSIYCLFSKRVFFLG